MPGEEARSEAEAEQFDEWELPGPVAWLIAGSYLLVIVLCLVAWRG